MKKDWFSYEDSPIFTSLIYGVFGLILGLAIGWMV